MSVYSPALAHIKKSDPTLYKACTTVHAQLPTTFKHKSNTELFATLCESIISQQLSVKAADTIYERVKKVCKGSITPLSVANARFSSLRKAGVSRVKAHALKDLAKKVKQGLVLSKLRRMDASEATESLVEVYGIGSWTAEMFLIFGLHHPDIFAPKDLGLVRAIEMLYKIKNPRLDTLTRISKKWIPYRSYACKILWKYRDTKNTSAL